MSKEQITNLQYERWMLSIKNVLKLNTYLKLLYFSELVDVFKDEEVVSYENIFLFLYNKGFISTNKEKIEHIKEMASLGLPAYMNGDIRFHITETGWNFIIELEKSNIEKYGQQAEIEFPN